MAWIESHQSLSRHRKTLHAVALLQIDKHKLIGHLHELWWWGLDNADIDGRLGHTPPEVIAQGAEWPVDDAGRFVDALVAAGFMERTTDGGLVLHDWYQYAGKLNEKRQTDAERKRLARQAAARDVPPASGQRPADVQRTSNGHRDDGATTAQVPTNQPNQPNKPNTDDTRARADATDPPEPSTPDAELWAYIRANISVLESVPDNRTQIIDYTNRLGPVLMLEACRRAVGANVRKLNYVASICETWIDAGAKTLADVAVLDRQHTNRKQAADRSRGSPSEPKAWAAIRQGLAEGGEDP